MKTKYILHTLKHVEDRSFFGGIVTILFRLICSMLTSCNAPQSVIKLIKILQKLEKNVDIAGRIAVDCLMLAHPCLGDKMNVLHNAVL